MKVKINDEWVSIPILKGDPGDPGEPTEVVQSTGQSTTAVMSQKAITDIIGDLTTIIDNI